ncbi:MAG: ABC transporter permease [Christensenellales bacterium]|jgi:putative aldouronate transport system permease protein
MKVKREQDFKLFLYILPVVIFIIIFKYLPLWGWSYAFVRYIPGKSLAKCQFVGLQNFRDLFSNPIMQKNILRVLRNTFGINFVAFLFSLLPMFFAIFLSEVRNKRFQKVVQTATTLPNFISWVIIFSMALSMFGSNGMVNSTLKALGTDAKVNVLTSNKHVWLTQVLLQQWKMLGWNAIVYFAGIAGLDQEIYEAAMVDGASKMQRIWHITIPQLIPTYFVLLIISIGNFLNTGVDQYLAFGNALNNDYIEVLDLYVYNLGIGTGQISYGVVVGTLKSLVALVLFFIANTASKIIRGTSVF